MIIKALNPYARAMRCKTPKILKLDQSQSCFMNGYALRIIPAKNIEKVLQKMCLWNSFEGK